MRYLRLESTMYESITASHVVKPFIPTTDPITSRVAGRFDVSVRAISRSARPSLGRTKAVFSTSFDLEFFFERRLRVKTGSGVGFGVT